MGHSMYYIVDVLDIQGEDSDRFVTRFVKLFYGGILVLVAYIMLNKR